MPDVVTKETSGSNNNYSGNKIDSDRDDMHLRRSINNEDKTSDDNNSKIDNVEEDELNDNNSDDTEPKYDMVPNSVDSAEDETKIDDQNDRNEEKDKTLKTNAYNETFNRIKKLQNVEITMNQ